MIGVDDDKVDQALQIMRDNCTQPSDPAAHRATIFVLNVNRYDHF
jgi:uncharacterized protein YaaQ